MDGLGVEHRNLGRGVGFFYQDLSWSAYLFGPGYTALVILWFYELAQAFRLRWALQTDSETTTDTRV